MSKKSEYDENGHWIQERSRIKGAVRRVFRIFPQMKDVLKKARVELPPALKKDGTPGKRPQVRYRCAICNGLFSRKDVQVDHLVTVVDLWRKEDDMTYDEVIRGICCRVENLQVACSTPLKRNKGRPSCHKLKTDEENFIRREIHKDMTKEQIENKVKRGIIDSIIEDYKSEYSYYLLEKESKRIEKEERKRVRGIKRKNK